MDRAFAQYLLMLHDRYLLERRWPDSTFWKRRHAPDDSLRRSTEQPHDDDDDAV